jgi:hypothetical protein
MRRGRLNPEVVIHLPSSVGRLVTVSLLLSFRLVAEVIVTEAVGVRSLVLIAIAVAVGEVFVVLEMERLAVMCQ